MVLTTHPHLAQRLKKEQSYTSTPPLCLHTNNRVNFTFLPSYLIFNKMAEKHKHVVLEL
jgi:hypothetical protein